MFLMLGDNAFPRVLQHLETTSTLEALQHNSLAHHSMTNHMPKEKKKNSQAATHMSKNSMQKKSHVQKKNSTTKTHMTKNCSQPKKKKQCSTKNFTTIKIFHKSIHNYQIFFHNHAQKFLHDQDSQQIISYMSVHNK